MNRSRPGLERRGLACLIGCFSVATIVSLIGGTGQAARAGASTGQQPDKLHVTKWLKVSGYRDGKKVVRCLSGLELKPGMEFSQIEVDKAKEMEDAPNNYPEQSWDRRGDPSRARDCAGAVMQNLMARFNAEIEPDKRAYAFGADNFYQNVLKPFGWEIRIFNIRTSYEKGDIVVFKTGGKAAHVATVINETPVSSRTNVFIETKDGDEGTFVNRLPLAGFSSHGANPGANSEVDRITVVNQELIRHYGNLADAEIWRIDKEIKFELAANEAACRSAETACAPQDLGERIAKVIPSLPFFAQSNQAKTSRPVGDPLSMHYNVEQADGAVAIDDPAKIVFGAGWQVGCASPARTETERQETQAAYRGKLCQGGGEVTSGVLGENSCMTSTGERGTLDIANYGDPYTGYAKIFVATPSLTLTVSAGVALHTSKAHGPRGRPEVIQAAKKAAEDWAQGIASRLMGEMDIPPGAGPAVIAALLPGAFRGPEPGVGAPAAAGYVSQARALVDQRNLAGALAPMQQAYQLAPASPAVNYDLSCLYQPQDQPLTALKHLQQYAQLAPGAPDRDAVEARMAVLQAELQRHPRAQLDPTACRDVFGWAETEKDVAKRAKDVGRQQAVLEILIASQRGDCATARKQQESYRARYPR